MEKNPQQVAAELMAKIAEFPPHERGQDAPIRERIIDYEELQRQQKLAAEKAGAATAPEPIKPSKFQPSTYFRTTKYPEYEGREVIICIGGVKNTGFIGWDINLPPVPKKQAEQLKTCPICHSEMAPDIMIMKKGSEAKEIISRSEVLPEAEFEQMLNAYGFEVFLP